MKVLFLTGCNGQLGLSFSKVFKQKNWYISGLDLEKITSNPNLDHYVSGSVCLRATFKNLFRTLEGLNPSDDVHHISLINNAGVAVFTPSEERTDDEFDFVTKVNLLGPIYGMTEFKKYFIDSSSENFLEGKINLSIINISSIYSLISPNNSIYTDTARNSSEIYGATKAGLNQLTKYFAVRYAGHNIQVNAIAPGGVLNDTVQGPSFIENYSNLVPMRRLCQSSEVAELACDITSSSVKYLTGQIISIDGGMSSW